MWQTTRTTPLIDYSYQIENAYRIYQGQMPYRDFFLVVAPGTYYALAFLMCITGGYIHSIIVIYTAIISYITVLLTCTILTRLTPARFLTILPLVPLIVSSHSLYPYPIYDINAITVVLASIALYIHVRRYKTESPIFYLLIGLMSVITVFMKQNIGGVFVIVFGIGVLIDVWTRENVTRKRIISSILLLTGICIPLVMYCYYLLSHNAYDAFVYQTFTFPKYSRNIVQQIDILIQQYKLGLGYLHPSHLYQLFTTYQTVQFEELYRNSILILWTVLSILSMTISTIQLISGIQKKHIPDIYSLLPFVLVPTALSSYLAHDIVGSSYSTWPVVMILLAYTFRSLSRMFHHVPWHIIHLLVILFFTAVLSRAVVENNFLRYYYHYAGKNAYHANLPPIAGLSTPGPWIVNMEAMFDYVEKHIPKNESVVFLPGEDPFFAVTKRINPLPFVQLHYQTYPMDYNSIILMILDKQVEWIIVKKQLQVFPNLGLADPVYIIEGISSYYTLAQALEGYDVYSRIK